MGYIEKSSIEGEGVVRIVPLHWLDYVSPTILSGGLLIAGFFTYAVTVLVIPFLWIEPLTTERAITSRRIVVKKGFFNVKTEEMQLAAIETVEFKQSILGRLLGFGTVRATGRGVSSVSLTTAPAPYEIKKQIETAQTS